MVRRFPRRQLLSFLVLAVATCSITRVSSFVPPPLPGSCSRRPSGGEKVVRGASEWAKEMAGAVAEMIEVEVEKLGLRLELRLEQRLQALREELKQDLRQALGEDGGSRRQQQEAEEDAVVERALQHITFSMSMWYATPLCARSIFDLTDLLTDADSHMLGEMGEDPTAEGRARLVRRVTARLVREDVPGQLRRAILEKLEAAGRPALGRLGGDSRVPGEALSRLSLQLQLEVVEALELLDGFGVATFKNEEQQILALEREDGVGVMCLVAAAFPHLYLHTNSSTTTGQAPALLVPPRELHCDLRYRYAEGSSGLFKLGTVGWSKDMPSTVRQLGQCLGALRWLHNTCLPPEKREKRLGFVGRYYLLRKADELRPDLMELEEECREEAREVWGYGFGVMDMRSVLGFEEV